MITPPFRLASNATMVIDTLEVAVWLNFSTTQTSTTATGLENSGLKYDGNVIAAPGMEIWKFPDTITVDSRPWVTFKSGVEGEFVFEQLYISQWNGLNKIIGQRFTGYLFPKRRSQTSDWD